MAISISNGSQLSGLFVFFEFVDNRDNESDVVDLLGFQLKPLPFREDGHGQIYNALYFSFLSCLITQYYAIRQSVPKACHTRVTHHRAPEDEHLQILKVPEIR